MVAICASAHQAKAEAREPSDARAMTPRASPSGILCTAIPPMSARLNPAFWLAAALHPSKALCSAAAASSGVANPCRRVAQWSCSENGEHARAHRVHKPVDRSQQQKSAGEPQNRALPAEELGHFRKNPEQGYSQQHSAAERHQAA